MSRDQRRSLRPLRHGGEHRQAERFGDLTTQVSETTGGVPSPILSRSPVLPQAFAYRGSAGGLAAGVWTPIPMAFVAYDYRGPHWVAGQPSRLTCAVPGLYAITAGLEWSVAGAGNYYGGITVNGGFISIEGRASAGLPVNYSMAVMYRLAAGQYVEINALSSVASTVSGTGVYGANIAMSFLSP